MPVRTQFEYAGEDARPRRENNTDTGRVPLGLACLGSIHGCVSFVLTGVYMACTTNILGQVHSPGTINPSKLGYGKAVVDGLTMAVPLYIAGISFKRGYVSASILNIGMLILFGCLNILISALTFTAYGQEGYGGLVGDLPSSQSATVVSRKNHGHQGPPPPPTYLTDQRARDNIVRVWIASGFIEALASLFMAGAAAMMMVARSRNRR